MTGKKLKLSSLRAAAYPQKIKPMLATLTDKPFNSKDWVFEIKWDGYRAIAGIKGKTVSLTSRNLLAFDSKYPTIMKALSLYKKDMVIDGELVAIDKDNKPSFQHLQNYQKTGIGNIVYYVFDILWYEGFNTENSTLLERKQLLKSIIKNKNNIFYCEHFAENGIALFKQAKKLGLEGIIAKKSDSSYYEGARSKSWLKIKTINTMDAVICGYTGPRGSRKYFGSLILGVYDKKKLTYIGHTGTGFNEEALRTLFTRLNRYVSKSSPFEVPPKPNAPVTWLKPKLVCEVKFSQLTDDGIMRHPVFMRMREDKNAGEVTLKGQLKKKQNG